VCGPQVFHQVLLHAEGHATLVALVRLLVRVHDPLVLVHRVRVSEFPVAI